MPENLLSSDYELVNLFAALSWPVPGYPAYLHDAGFRLWGIEREISTEKGTACPDVGLVHPDEDHTLLIECKSGTVELSQAERLASITPSNYVPSSFQMGDLRSHSHQVAYAMLAARCAGNAEYLRREGVFPMLGVGIDPRWVVALFEGSFRSPAAQSVLGQTLQLPPETPEIVRYTVTTDRRAILKDALFTMIVEHHAHAEWTFDELVDAILNHIPGTGYIYNFAIRRKVKNVLRSLFPIAQRTDLNKYLHRTKNALHSENRWALIVPKRGMTPRWRSGFVDGLNAFLNRMQQGPAPEHQIPLQLDPIDWPGDDDQ